MMDQGDDDNYTSMEGFRSGVGSGVFFYARDSLDLDVWGIWKFWYI